MLTLGCALAVNARSAARAFLARPLEAFVMCFTAKFKTTLTWRDKVGLVINQLAIAGDIL